MQTTTKETWEEGGGCGRGGGGEIEGAERTKWNVDVVKARENGNARNCSPPAINVQAGRVLPLE